MKPDDLSDLEVLDENTIVQALKSRYNKDKYYVSIIDETFYEIIDIFYICIYIFLPLINSSFKSRECWQDMMLSEKRTEYSCQMQIAPTARVIMEK